MFASYFITLQYFDEVNNFKIMVLVALDARISTALWESLEGMKMESIRATRHRITF